MKVCAIIAEYNPFHNGHLYQIERTKQLVDYDFLIVLMSGNFTQRGDAAILDKFKRSKIAKNYGADLVIELPAVYSVSSAQHFACAAINIIENLNIVTHLSFGSEIEDASLLKKAADILASNDSAFHNSLKSWLDTGLSYKASLNKALNGRLKENINLANSNTVLALQYLRALNLKKSKIEPVIIKRIANAYSDCSLKERVSSASSIRRAKLCGEDFKRCVPKLTYDFLFQSKCVSLNDFTATIMTGLLKLGPEGISKLFEVNEGLQNRIFNSLKDSSSAEQLIDQITSKRYAKGTISRIMIYSMLDITKDLMNELISSGYPSYARILQIKESGLALLKLMSKTSSIKIIANAKEEKALGNTLQKVFALDKLATNIYSVHSGCQMFEDYYFSPFLSE